MCQGGQDGEKQKKGKGQERGKHGRESRGRINQILYFLHTATSSPCLRGPPAVSQGSAATRALIADGENPSQCLYLSFFLQDLQPGGEEGR